MPTRPSHPADSELRRYLLGTATEAEAEAFSLRILEDASDPDGSVLAGALAEEDELFDEYARGELDAEATHRFERVVLSHQDGRRRVEFARALAQRSEQHTKKRTTLAAPLLAAAGIEPAEVAPETELREDGDDATAKSSFWRRLFASLHSPVARPAWALCALLLVVGLAQTIRLAQLREPSIQVADKVGDPAADPVADREAEAAVEDMQKTAPATAEGATRIQSDMGRLESEAADLRRRLEDSAQQVASLRSELERAAASTPRVVKMLLAATTRGSEVPEFDAPGDDDEVELQVDLSGAPELDRVRIRLLDGSGFQVWGRPNAEVEGDTGLQALRLGMPTGILRPGRYTLLVETAGPDETSWQDVAGYEFRIRSN